MKEKSFQEYYTYPYNHCYGCGTQNEKGMHIHSYRDGEESVCEFIPEEHQISFPGFVYGGLIASLVDCHSIATAAAAAYRAHGREMGTEPPLRFVTASLKVDYLKPTPMGAPLNLRSRVRELKERKALVDTVVSVNGTICARGETVAVVFPESMLP